MANFIFNWATTALANATLDLSTGNYYAHLVNTAPLVSHFTVADLTLNTTSGYTSAPLTGLSLNSTRWTFDSFNFPKYVFASVPIGVVICKRTGLTPANTDSIICYTDFTNSDGQVITLIPGTYIVNLQFGAGGAINFLYRYQYTSGAYNAALGSFPPGLIHLLGTKNNTEAYSIPFNATTSPDGTVFFNKASDSNATARIALDFGSNSIRVGTFGIHLSSSSTFSCTIRGSNYLPSWDSASINNDASWTVLTSSIFSNVTGWVFMNVANNTFFRYFKMTRSAVPNTLSEIEFYNSTLLSPTLNMA